VVIRFSATHFALVDPNAQVVTNVAVRSEVIPIAATHCAAIPNVVIQNVVDQGATGVVLNAAPNGVPNAVTLNVVSQTAMDDFPNEAVPNEAVLSVVLNAVQDVAPGVVLRCAVTQSDRYAVDQCVADRDAMVDSQD